MNLYLLKHVKQSHHTRIKNLDIFNHIQYVYSKHCILLCQKTENWEFAPMGKIRKKIQWNKSCHNVCF